MKRFGVYYNFIILVMIYSSGVGCNKPNKYPPQIIENGLEAQYDSARWFLYFTYGDCYCDEASPPDFDVNGLKPLGYYDIELRGIEKILGFDDVDTFVFNLDFKIHNSIYCHWANQIRIWTTTIPSSLTFIRNDSQIKKIEWVDSFDSYSEHWEEPTRDPKELKLFIEKNRSKLNKWFVKEAIHRGLIEE